MSKVVKKCNEYQEPLWVSNVSKEKLLAIKDIPETNELREAFNCHNPYIKCKDCFWNPEWYTINTYSMCLPTILLTSKTGRDNAFKLMKYAMKNGIQSIKKSDIPPTGD